VRRARNSLWHAALPLALALLLVAACGGSESAVGLPLGRQLSAKASFTPTVHLFAEPVVATVEVVVDGDHLDPGLIKVQARFLPYDVTGFRLQRDDRDRFTLLRYEWALRCLRLACIPEILPSAAGEAETGRGERRSFAVQAAQVRYEEPGKEQRTLTRATWPELVSVSRIKQSDVPQYGFVFKASATPLPEPDYRVSPAFLGAGLLVAAGALLVLPAILAIGWWRRRRPLPIVEQEEEISRLERALRLVEWTRECEDGAERREALEVLALELGGLQNDELAEEARVLAWSPASPAPEQAARLVGSVRGTKADV
jgi:hypothetical protein